MRKYLGSVVPQGDNFYAALNSAVFTDGSFVYVPKGVRCPMELSTYFRINAAEHRAVRAHADHRRRGQLRELPRGLHRAAARREPAARRGGRAGRAGRRPDQVLDGAELVPGRREGRGGIYNFVTKRGPAAGRNSKISWTQVETGSAITWKYPSCILQGDNSVGEFYSVAVTNNRQQADTGTKMIHIGKNTRSSRIVSKGICAGRSNNTYRGLVRVLKGRRGRAQPHPVRLDADRRRCGAHTVPYIEVKNRSAKVEHEATTSKISEDQLFYCRQRGLSDEEAVALIVNGFCKEVMQELPMEFAVEAQKLLAISLEGSVG